GRKGPFGGDEIINLILMNRTCAPYIASRLWKFFVSDEIDVPLCISLGELLRESKYELRPVLRTLLSSRAFYAEGNIGSQIKSPVQLVIGTIRSLGVKPPEYQRLHGALEQMGQVPLMPPNVKGWPGGRQWINTSTMFVRYNTALWLAGGEPIGGRKSKRRNQEGVDVDTRGTPEELVDAWAARLIQRPILSERRKVLLDAVGKKPTEESVRTMVNLVLSTPEFQLC
ncbi:MAG TPA: DUF1800 family protein, partial [Tepidisphaeraceae bacterium]